MDQDIRFALVAKPTEPTCKPMKFDSLPSLARRIQRLRGSDSLQGFDAGVCVFGEEQPRPGVSLFATDPGGRSRYLGWAFLNGRDWRALQAALHAIAPNLPTLGKAA